MFTCLLSYLICQCQSEFVTWLVIASAISKFTNTYNREKQSYDDKSGKNLRKKMSLNADGRSIKTGMVVHPKGESSM